MGGFVGNTPVLWSSKRQSAIATSSYSAEMCAGRIGAEEAICLREMLRSFGVPLGPGPNNKPKPTLLVGDNMGSLISTDTLGSECKKKAVSISYHYIRECNAAGIISIRKVHTEGNFADPGT